MTPFNTFPLNNCVNSQGARNITFDASQLYASAAQSTVSITPGAPATVGNMQYVVANLLSSTRSPVVVADNVKVIATGRLPLSIGTLGLQRTVCY
jgi:hypothetical protein